MRISDLEFRRVLFRSKVKDELDALGPWDFEPPSDLIATERVRVGDTLSAYAKQHSGDAELWPDIYGANLDNIADAAEIFPGQVVRIPSRTRSEEHRVGNRCCIT